MAFLSFRYHAYYSKTPIRKSGFFLGLGRGLDLFLGEFPLFYFWSAESGILFLERMDLPGGGGDMAFRDWGYKGLVGVCWGKGWIIYIDLTFNKIYFIKHFRQNDDF